VLFLKKIFNLENKKAVEFGFNLIFSLIVGAFILFLAIYFASKFIKTQENVFYTESAAQIVSFLDPFETGIASGKSSEINFKKETRIYNEYCNPNDNLPFGLQKISFSEKTLGEKFGDKGEKIQVKNKYIFSDKIVQGKKMNIFSVSFSMPFKISDLLIIFSKDYCFYDPPQKIVDDVEGLRIKNIYFPNETEKCNGVRVCFKDYSNCDIKVYEDEKYVQKEGKRLYYYDNLIYGAIFSSSDVYECNVKRLMNKIEALGEIYENKIKIIERKGCDPRIELKLSNLMNITRNIDNSKALNQISKLSDEIDEINRAANPGCKLFN